MKRFLFIVLAALLLTACGSSTNKNSVSGSSESKPSVGDTVVAKWSGTSFAEGKIRSIEGQKANIGWSNKDRTPDDVDLADVYAMPKAGAPIKVKTGDFVIAKESSAADNTDWEGAQVTSVSDGVIAVKSTTSDSAYNLAPEKVIAVSPVSAADLKAEAEKYGFLTRARAHKPQAPAGYKPKVGEHILGGWTSTAWFGGRVKSINGDKALVEWEGPTKPDEATFDNIVPYPTAANSTQPVVGDYVLVKPTSGSWDYAQVSSVNGSDIEVKGPDGKSRTVKPGEFVVLK